MAIATTYYLKIGDDAVGELANVSFVSVNGAYTNVKFQYKDNVGGLYDFTHNITLTSAGSGNYTASQELQHGIQISGHDDYGEIAFTFNENDDPEFSGGHFIGPKDDDSDWSASSSSPIP